MKKENGGVPPKVAAVHDLSCVGRCALTVVIPILSAQGIQVCPLPTAVLSTHTGGYENFTFLDLTDEMPKIVKHWESIEERFDAVYSGFLGSAGQIRLVLDFVSYVRRMNPGALFLADPVMGDDGEKYATYTDEMCRLTASLADEADIVTPNLTEAAILLGAPYNENPTECEIENMLAKLSHGGKKSVVITGIVSGDSERKLIGAAYFDRDAGESGKYFTEWVSRSYPGTGEVFASVLLGKLIGENKRLSEAVKDACEFVHDAVLKTSRTDTPVRSGVHFEPLLKQL